MSECKAEFVSGGRTFAGHVFESTPSSARRQAAVMVLHGGAGPGAHESERAGRLAKLGYVSFVPDLFGEVFETREHGIEIITGLIGAPPVLRGRLASALAWLRAHPSVDPSRVAAIGFCFGGLAALELARSGADVRAIVSFHGGLTTRAPAQSGHVKPAILVCAGAADPLVTRDHRSAFEEEMTRAEADWQLQVYAAAMHGFTERPDVGRPRRAGSEYHEAADRRSWAAMRNFLDERLASVGTGPER